jgi:hypothetical protein
MNSRTWYLLVGTALGLTMLPPAHAISGCTNGSLSGTFGMQLSGTVTPGVAKGVGGVALTNQGASSGSTSSTTSPAPTASIARLFFDGAGDIAGYSAANVQGQWLQGNITGTYNVNDDCSVAFAVMDISGNTQNLSGIVVAQGSSVLLLQTDAGAGVSGKLQPLKSFCQTSDLSGTFGVQYAGTVANNAAFSSTGLLSLDGQGDVTATEWRLNGGASSQVTSTGTIAVNPDCSASLTLISTSDGSAVNLSGLLSLDEKQIFFVESDAGTAVTGSAIAQ